MTRGTLDTLDDMTEVEKHVPNVISGTVGNTASSAVTALCSIAGVTLHEPSLGIAAVPVGAAAGALSGEAASIVIELWRQRRERVRRFADEAEIEANTQMEEILTEVAVDSRALEMLARCVEAAAHSIDEDKIDLLARIFVRGVRDTAKIDESSILVEAVRQLEAPHLRILSILAEPGPHLVPGRPVSEPDSKPDNIPPFPTWRVEDILEEDPGIGDTFDALIARLQALGFVYDEGNGRLDYEPLWYLTRLGQACVQYFKHRGARE